MSRSITQIEQAFIQKIQADPILGPLLTSTSSTAIWRLWTYINSVGQSTNEQLYDQFLLNTESLIANGAPMTGAWLQNQVFNWQYSTSVPQIIQFNTSTFAPYWPTVNPSLRIVSRCSVQPFFLNEVNILTATGSTPGPLDSSQLAALQAFLNMIGSPGIQYNAISLPADRISCAATVYFQGAYTSIIATSLLNAYNNYLSSIPFSGVLKISDLEMALRNVAGVNDVELNNVTARPEYVSFIEAEVLIGSNTQYYTQWKTVAGYLVDEDTSSPSGNDFLSLINLVAQ